MHRFSKYPLLKEAPSFVFGCLLPTFDSFSLDFTSLLMISIFSMLSILLGGKSMKSVLGIMTCFTFMGLGAAISTAKQPKLSDPEHYQKISTIDSNAVLIGSPDGSPKKTSYGMMMYFNLKYIRSKGIMKSTSGKILVHVKTDTIHDGPQEGGLYALRIQLRRPSPASIPGGFDWEKHLKKKGVYHEGWVIQSDIMELKRPNGISAFSNQCKEYVEDLLYKRLNNRADLGVASALLMGNENWLDNETEDKFAAAGVLHVLCVSGMHLVLLYGILIKLFKPLLRKKPLVSHVVFPFLICSIWFYSLLTGMSPSITRAATMTTFVIFSEWMERRVDKTNMMCASLILLSCLDPLMLLSEGFQLSFLAVCGIFYLHPVILTAFEPGNRIKRQLWEMTSVTLSAQLATFPLSLYLFGQFPNWFLLANMIIVPVSSIVMYAGMLMIMLGNIPWIGEWIGLATALSIEFLRYLVDLFSALPFAVTENIYYPVLMVSSTYILVIMLFYFFKSNSYESLVGCLLAIISCLASIYFVNEDFVDEESCWIIKSKAGPVFIKQQGFKAEIIAFQGAKETELQRIENTMATKRNVKSFKKTIINPKTNFNLIQFHTTFINRFPKKWNHCSENLKNLDKTQTLLLVKRPYEDFWDDMEKTLPDLKKLIYVKRVDISEKSLAKAESLGIQILNLDELGYIRLESKVIQ